VSARKPNKMKDPQLFGESAAADQARRAAGVQFTGPGSIFNENQNPVTKFISARKAVRRMARLQGFPAKALSSISRSHDTARREALGLPPREFPR